MLSFVKTVLIYRTTRPPRRHILSHTQTLEKVREHTPLSLHTAPSNPDFEFEKEIYQYFNMLILRPSLAAARRQLESWKSIPNFLWRVRGERAQAFGVC